MKSNPVFDFVKGLTILLVIFVLVMNLTYPIFYSDYVEEYSRSFNVDKYLIYSIIRAESNFNKSAISDKNAKGLMQVLDDTGNEMFSLLEVPTDKRNIYNPGYNIMVGTYYLRTLLNRYEHDEMKAIAAYNSGMSNVDKWSEKGSFNFKDNIEFKETVNYVNRVERNHRIYILLYEKLNLSWTSLPDWFSEISVIIRNAARSIKRSVI